MPGWAAVRNSSGPTNRHTYLARQFTGNPRHIHGSHAASTTARCRVDRDGCVGQIREALSRVESPDELRRFIEAAYAEVREDLAREWRATGQGGRARRSLEERTGGLRALVAVLAMLDAGLRVGEVAGLTWGQVRWGADGDDPTRALVIDRSRPRGGEEGPPKSGRTRVVALSRRLRGAARAVHRSVRARALRSGPPRLRAPQLHPACLAADPRTGGDRPPLTQGPARHLRELAALARGLARLRLAPARPRGCCRHRTPLRALVRRQRVSRADAAPGG